MTWLWIGTRTFHFTYRFTNSFLSRSPAISTLHVVKLSPFGYNSNISFPIFLLASICPFSFLDCYRSAHYKIWCFSILNLLQKFSTGFHFSNGLSVQSTNKMSWSCQHSHLKHELSNKPDFNITFSLTL